MKMYPPFIKKLETTDPELFKLVSAKHDLVTSPGALDVKTKILITLSVDAFAGSTGVRPIADLARSFGITDEELRESLQIAYHVAGNKVLNASSAAFD